VVPSRLRRAWTVPFVVCRPDPFRDTGWLSGKPPREENPLSDQASPAAPEAPEAPEVDGAAEATAPPSAPVAAYEPNPEAVDAPIAPAGMGTFAEDGTYVPRSIIEDDLGGMSMDDAYSATMVQVEDGQIVEGTVVKVDRDEVLLDIGYKSEGVIPARELSIRNDVDPSEIVSLGDAIEALVLQKEDKEGRLVLSKKRAQYERAWGTIEKIKEEDGVVSGRVIEVVKGGLILDIGLRGFLPASLVELRRVRDLQPYVDKTLEAKIIELDKNRNNVVLSRRAWLEETQKEQREDFLANLKPGEVRKGVVSSVVNFGAFVDLGGMDGLVHVSELSWKHVDHPGSVVQVGDEIEVQVLEVDLDRERISLSLKATQQDPWQEFAGNHRVGELVYGRVTKLVPFGAFVQVGDGIEGLVHISEMSAHHVDLPEQVVTPGEELWVKIIDLDLQRRRISLSIKQAAEGGVVAAEYQEHFGEHAYDEEGNYIGTDTTEAQEAWAELYGDTGTEAPVVEGDAAPAEADAPVEPAIAEAEPAVLEAETPVAEVATPVEADAADEPAAAAEPAAEAAPETEPEPEPESTEAPEAEV
jgi:small subunit ribosomal protein S1